ncbi:MAG: type IV secretion system DNA-binding domain-containing protein, partial [Patescibacteria group bacterium]
VGQTTYRDKNTLFGIKRKDRRQHVYILGKSGTGKSALMFNMIIQNIENGDGVCMVDPHGENVEAVLSAIPPHRMKDVVYFNPADTEYHIGFNVLELLDPKYKHLVASGLMGIFTKIWANAWSARMEYILNNAILALLDTPGSTLLGIPRLLVDKDYRQKVIANLKDPVIKAFWIHEYEAWQDKFRNEAIAPIQNKVGQFLSTSIIRNIVGQAKSTVDIFDLMNQEKIFLVNVSKGRIGEDNSSLLGGMIITKIQLAAMERVRIPEDERKDFYLYVDEFQNFVTESFAGILSEARKYRLNLTVAHQYTAQLIADKNSSVRDAVFGNVGTMIVFRVGADDAKFLEKEFEPEFTPQDILNLPNFKIYLKLMIDGTTSRPFSAKTLSPLVKSGNKEIEQEVIRSSRALYCRPREVVEQEINDWSGMSLGNDGDNMTGEKFPIICSNC